MNKLVNTALRMALAAGVVAVAAPAFAQDAGTWVARVRAVRIDTADKSDAVTVAGVGSLPSDAIQVSKKTIPEVDFSYYFTNNLAAELILTVPQKHNVNVPLLGGKIGDFKELPPTLTAQWHFLPGEMFDPYVGAGLNVTLINSVNLPANLGLKSTSVGVAAQLGADFNIDKNWSINIDAKYVEMGTKLTQNGATLGNVTVNPWLLGLGVGYRF